MKFDLGSFVLGGIVVALIAAQMMGYIDMVVWASVGLEVVRETLDYLAML